jgi:predicted PurR-regulated permease PerM
MGWFGDLQRVLGSWGAPLSAPKGESVQSVAGAVLANTLRITTGVFGVVIEVLAILVLAAYFVIDEREIGRLLLSFVPAAHRPTAQRLAPRVLDRVGGYVRGQLVSSVCVGILIAVMLSLMGVRYALLIGTLAAVFNVVPFVGATLAAGLAVLAALNESLGLAAATGGGMVAVQALEGKLLAPYFVGRATGLHALAVLLALLAGLHLAGLVGGLVAVPLVAGTWEVVRTLWVEPRRSA